MVYRPLAVSDRGLHRSVVALGARESAMGSHLETSAVGRTERSQGLTSQLRSTWPTLRPSI